MQNGVCLLISCGIQLAPVCVSFICIHWGHRSQKLQLVFLKAMFEKPRGLFGLWSSNSLDYKNSCVVCYPKDRTYCVFMWSDFDLNDFSCPYVKCRCWKGAKLHWCSIWLTDTCWSTPANIRTRPESNSITIYYVTTKNFWVCLKWFLPPDWSFISFVVWGLNLSMINDRRTHFGALLHFK